MKITKYEHACMVVELEGQNLVIDPGTFVTSLPKLHNVAAVVITHVHADHFDPKHIKALTDADPGIMIFTTQQAADQLDHERVTVVQPGDKVEAGPFKLAFSGGKHALIHDNKPQDQNVGVLVNKTLYYPGDSFDLPDTKEVKVAAVPVSGPWMKIGEAMDFILALKPAKVFPAHDGFLSEAGGYFTDNWVSQGENYEYYPLKPGESFEV